MAFRIADNKTSEFSSWADDLLAAELRALQGEEFDLAATGFGEAELKRLLMGAEEAKSPGDQTGELKSKFQILIECETEADHGEALEALMAEGYKCRSLIS